MTSTQPDAEERLRALLAALGWRPETLARKLNAFAARSALPQRLHEKTPYKWLRGQSPQPPWPGLVAALLTEHLGQPVTPASLGWRDDGARTALPAMTGLEVAWNAAGTLQALHAVTDAGPVDRRLFLLLVGSAVTAPAHEWLVAPGGQPAGADNGAVLPGEVADHLEGLAAGLRRMDDQLGGGALLPLVSDHIRYVTGLLDHRRYSDAVGRRLHGVIAELLRLAGWLSFDAGQHAQAQRYYVAALHAAHTAGDRALGANILGFMSCQAKDLGQHRQAVTLAETARTGYPGATPVVTAILHLRAAEAYANDGDPTACRRAIDAAFDRFGDAGPEHGAPDWCYWFDTAQAHAQAGYCYLTLADWPRARGHLTAALREQGEGCQRETALRNILLATTYVRQDSPDLDRALAHGTRAVDALAGQVDSARCVGHAGRLVEQLTRYRRQPGVRDFTDRTRPLLTNSAH